MMASFMSYFGGRKDAKQATRDAIVTLRQQLQMQDKKEKYLEEKIAKDLKIARENAVSNRNGSFCDPLVEMFRGTERCALDFSRHCSSTTEKGVRAGAGTIIGHAVATGDADKHFGVSQL